MTIEIKYGLSEDEVRSTITTTVAELKRLAEANDVDVTLDFTFDSNGWNSSNSCWEDSWDSSDC